MGAAESIPQAAELAAELTDPVLPYRRRGSAGWTALNKVTLRDSNGDALYIVDMVI